MQPGPLWGEEAEEVVEQAQEEQESSNRGSNSLASEEEVEGGGGGRGRGEEERGGGLFVPPVAAAAVPPPPQPVASSSPAVVEDASDDDEYSGSYHRGSSSHHHHDDDHDEDRSGEDRAREEVDDLVGKSEEFPIELLEDDEDEDGTTSSTETPSVEVITDHRPYQAGIGGHFNVRMAGAGDSKPTVSVQIPKPPGKRGGIGGGGHKVIKMEVPETSGEFESCLLHLIPRGILDITHIPGLFREGDNVFIPLSVIIDTPRRFEECVLCISNPTNKPTSPKDTSNVDPAVLRKLRRYQVVAFCVIALFGIQLGMRFVDKDIQWNYETLKASVEWVFVQGISIAFATVVDVPARYFYRNAPVVGWEGLTLPEICSRVTHYENPAFWAANYQECVIIYGRGEHTYLLAARVVICILYLYVGFEVYKALVKARNAIRPSRDMVETFQAFNLLMKQVARASGGGGGR